MRKGKEAVRVEQRKETKYKTSAPANKGGARRSHWATRVKEEAPRGNNARPTPSGHES